MQVNSKLQHTDSVMGITTGQVQSVFQLLSCTPTNWDKWRQFREYQKHLIISADNLIIFDVLITSEINLTI